MGYPAGSNDAFEAWVALPEVRAALNVSGVFPDDAEWGGTAWEYPCEPLSRAHGTAELLAAVLALRILTVCVAQSTTTSAGWQTASRTRRWAASRLTSGRSTSS